MRFIQRVTIPETEFNKAVRDGSAGQKINHILETVRPEHVYFTLTNGHRSAVIVLDVKDPSELPALAEPWFLTFNATMEIDLVMTPQDLQKAGLEKFADKNR